MAAPTIVGVGSTDNPDGAAKTLSLFIPAGSPGELLVAAAFVDDRATSWSPAPGWTEIYNAVGADSRVSLAYKIAAAGEPPAVWTMTTAASGEHRTGGMLRLKGFDVSKIENFAVTITAGGMTILMPTPAITTTIESLIWRGGCGDTRDMLFGPPAGYVLHWAHGQFGPGSSFQISSTSASKAQIVAAPEPIEDFTTGGAVGATGAKHAFTWAIAGGSDGLPASSGRSRRVFPVGIQFKRVDQPLTSPGGGGSRAGVAVTPVNVLPVTTDLIAHWIADLIAGADSDPVSLVIDQSGNGNDLSAAGAERPLIKRGIINGHSVIDFDGVDDHLQRAAAISTALEGTVFAVLDFPALVSDDTIFSISEAGTDRGYIYCGIRASERPQIASGRASDGGVNNLEAAPTLTTATFHYIMWKSTGIAYEIRSNGITRTITLFGTTANDGTWWGDPHIFGQGNAVDTTTVGANERIGPFNFFDGRLAELIIYDKSKSSGEITSIESYLKTKYGL